MHLELVTNDRMNCGFWIKDGHGGPEFKHFNSTGKTTVAQEKMTRRTTPALASLLLANFSRTRHEHSARLSQKWGARLRFCSKAWLRSDWTMFSRCHVPGRQLWNDSRSLKTRTQMKTSYSSRRRASCVLKRHGNCDYKQNNFLPHIFPQVLVLAVSAPNPPGPPTVLPGLSSTTVINHTPFVWNIPFLCGWRELEYSSTTLPASCRSINGGVNVPVVRNQRRAFVTKSWDQTNTETRKLDLISLGSPSLI